MYQLTSVSSLGSCEALQSDLKVLYTLQSDLKVLYTLQFDLKVLYTLQFDLKVLYTLQSDLKVLYTLQSDLKVLSKFDFYGLNAGRRFTLPSHDAGDTNGQCRGMLLEECY